MPAKPKAKVFTLKETNHGLEISSKAGTVMVCKLGERQTALPAGSVMLTQMLGGTDIAVFDPPIPVDQFWLNTSARHSPGYVYWMHPADYDAAMRGP
jgi:hypothetical protein